jgi:hypothetical protein
MSSDDRNSGWEKATKKIKEKTPTHATQVLSIISRLVAESNIDSFQADVESVTEKTLDITVRVKTSIKLRKLTEICTQNGILTGRCRFDKTDPTVIVVTLTMATSDEQVQPNVILVKYDEVKNIGDSLHMSSEDKINCTLLMNYMLSMNDGMPASNWAFIPKNDDEYMLSMHPVDHVDLLVFDKLFELADFLLDVEFKAGISGKLHPHPHIVFGCKYAVNLKTLKEKLTKKRKLMTGQSGDDSDDWNGVDMSDNNLNDTDETDDAHRHEFTKKRKGVATKDTNSIFGFIGNMF